MRNTKGGKISRARKGQSGFVKKKDDPTGPVEFEEQRSMDIRMKPQPFQSLPKSDKKNI